MGSVLAIHTLIATTTQGSLISTSLGAALMNYLGLMG